MQKQKTRDSMSKDSFTLGSLLRPLQAVSDLEPVSSPFLSICPGDHSRCPGGEVPGRGEWVTVLSSITGRQLVLRALLVLPWLALLHLTAMRCMKAQLPLCASFFSKCQPQTTLPGKKINSYSSFRIKASFFKRGLQA